MHKTIILIFLSLFLPIKSFSQGSNIFDNSRVHIVKLTSLNQTDWTTIVDRYASKEYTPLKVEIDGRVVDSVGVRIKGNQFSPQVGARDKYQQFRLKFGKFKDGQKYDGLKDVNLHMSEILKNYVGYDICRTFGLVAPRTSFAKLYFDNVYIGIYLIVDEADKVFLKRNFDDDNGNLYKADDKGAYLHDTIVSAAHTNSLISKRMCL